jgi:hypothetical protein
VIKKSTKNKKRLRPRTTPPALPPPIQSILCSNCATPLPPDARFCPQCGQKNHGLNIPIGRLIEEMAEGVLHLDNKSLHTIKALVFKPGFLTTEYITGKRVRYVPPVRLYIFISFIFFFLLAFPAGGHSPADGSKKETTDVAITFYEISSAEVAGMNSAQLDSVLQKHSIDTTIVNRYVVHQLARIGCAGRGEFTHLLVKGISYMMFALMPVFAMVVYWLNRKKARYYIGTLVFSIHYHSMVFLLLFILAGITMIGVDTIVWLVPFIFFPIYLFLALRRVYNDTVIIAALKTVVVSVVHVLSVVFLFLVTVFISLLVF